MSSTLKTHSGTITEIGPQTQHPIGTKLAFIKLTGPSGAEETIPDVVVLGMLLPEVKLGASATLAIDRCLFTNTLFGIKAGSRATVSTDVGMLKHARPAAYALWGMGAFISVITLGFGLLPAALTFGVGGWMFLSMSKTPLESDVAAALEGV